jgi:uncharacterized phiE125 gp8 family phage protein
MYRPVLVTAPTIKPVTRAEAKAALDIGYSEKDALIDGLIAAATTYLDGWTGILGRALCEQTWRQDYDGFICWSWAYPGRRDQPPSPYFGFRLRLPVDPVISITSVKYVDLAGVQQTIAASNYTLKDDDEGAFVQFITTYPLPVVSLEPASVSVTYKAGYANAGTDPNFTSTAPDPIKQAMLLLIRSWFDNPTPVIIGATVEKVPFAVDALLAPFRRQQF